MQYSPLNFLLPSAVFDPMTALSVGGTLAGGAISAMGTLAGGSNAAQLGQMQQTEKDFEATQDIQNSAADTAMGGREALETAQKANLLRSSAVASAAAGGVNAGAGSALTNEEQITSRGRYAAAIQLFNGQNAASADLNKAAAAHYSGAVDAIGGQMQKQASTYSALGTLASAGGTAFKNYGGGNPFGGGGQLSSTTFGTGGASYPMYT